MEPIARAGHAAACPLSLSIIAASELGSSLLPPPPLEEPPQLVAAVAAAGVSMPGVLVVGRTTVATQ